MINITLEGRPLSLNHMYRSATSKRGKSFTYMTTEGKNAKTAWGIVAQSQMRLQGAEMFKYQKLSVQVVFHFEDNLRRDIDNYSKGLLDCLSGVAWFDDSQIWELSLRKGVVPKGQQPRTEIVIEELT